MLNLACRKGDLEGVVPHLVENGITHLQYADDTVIFVRNNQPTLRNLKFILYCYESMSGMKINYEKSEVFVVGGGSQTSAKVAQAFNSKMGVFLMKYLGIPVSIDRLSKAELSDSVVEVERRLKTWKCSKLSCGEKHS